MTRDEAENLLAQLVFDELDEPVRSELLAYLRTDAELTERLGDLRVTAGLLREGIAAEGEPTLDAAHLEALQKQTSRSGVAGGRWGLTRPIVFPRKALLAAALVAIAGTVAVALLLPSLGAARRSVQQLTFDDAARGWENEPFDAPTPTREPRGQTQWRSDESLAFVPGAEQATDSRRASGSLAQAETLNGYAYRGDHRTAPGAAKVAEARKKLRSQNDLSQGQAGPAPANQPQPSTPLRSRPDLDALDDARSERRRAEATSIRAGQSPGSNGAIPYDDLLTYPQDWPRVSREQLARSGAKDEASQIRRGTMNFTLTETPDFDEAPAFDLNAALSNTTSGNVRGGGGGSGQLVGVDTAPDSGLFGAKGRAESTEYRTRWSNDLGATPPAEPLPQQLAMQAQMQQLEELAVAVDDPRELLDLADARLREGDLHGARSMLRQAEAYVPEDQRPSRYVGGETERLAEMSKRIEVDHLQSEEATKQLAAGLARQTKRLELYERVMPAEEAMGQKLQAQQELAAAELDPKPEPAPEPALKPGDRLALSVYRADQPDQDESWRAQVDREGWIAVPGRGRLRVTGMTPSQVEHAVAEAKRLDLTEDRELAPDAVHEADAAVLLLPPEDKDTPEGEDASDDAAPQEAEQQQTAEPDQPAARAPRLMPVNPWVMTAQDRLSTFALDVDTASLGIARRYIHDGLLPPRHTVRMEEFINAFDYQYPAGRDRDQAFAVHAEAGPAPFAADANTLLVKVGVRGKVVGRDQAKPAHLIFVIDTSGSMERDDRLPLIKKSLAMLLDQLGPHDRVSVISYGTESRLLLENHAAGDKARILDTIESLQTGGSTNLFAGVRLGYDLAQRHFVTGGVNRVILCSDGVANVGPDQAEHLVEQVQQHREQGVTFTSVGVGTGGMNIGGPTSGGAASGSGGGGAYDDRVLEDLANTGDGSYLYVGSEAEARRLFVQELAATRPVIAFDAKVQVAFDPQRVRRYRLIGYENRDIADEDFRNDAIDAGEVGSGQSATALYEIELLGPARGDLPGGELADLGAVYVRYRDADTRQVRETQARLSSDIIARRSAGEAPRFYLAAAAAHLAETLRGSEHVPPDINGNLSRVQRVLEEVSASLPLDGRVADLLEMTRRAQGLPRAE